MPFEPVLTKYVKEPNSYTLDFYLQHGGYQALRKALAMTPEEIAQMLMKALQQGDNGMMRAVARQSVKRFAGMEPGRPVGGTYYLYRTLRHLDLDNLLEQLMEQARQQSPEPLSPLEERLELGGALGAASGHEGGMAAGLA